MFTGDQMSVNINYNVKLSEILKIFLNFAIQFTAFKSISNLSNKTRDAFIFGINIDF